MTDATVVREPDSSLVTTLHVTYALHAVGLAIGAFGASTVVGSFIFGWPSIIAVIINYVKRGDARGTWLESHFDVADPDVLVCRGVGVDPDRRDQRRPGARGHRLCDLADVGFFVLGIWAIYRIAKGWIAPERSSRDAV